MDIINKDKTLLVLDVDETLVHATEKQLDRAEDFKIANYNVFIRPYLSEFIEGVKDDYMIAIWSSATDDYVEEVVKRIIPKTIELKFVWGRSRCSFKRNLKIDDRGYYSDNYLDHYNYVKPLKKLKRKGYQLNRILIVDDTPHKSQDNYGNAIYPKEYRGELEDDELKYLLEYLKILKDKTDIRHIEKRNWRVKIENKLNKK